MLFPRQFYEYNQAGEPVYYSPYDGKVHKGYMFTDNGFWDTFRAQFPLNLLLHPEMHGRYLKSLLDAYDQSGWLPSWSCPGHSGGMIGNHAFSLLADAWVKGVRTFDPQQALKAMYHDATDKAPFGQSIGRSGWRDYYLKGYVPFGTTSEPTAKTLEYAYNDFCAMRLAQEVGNKTYERFFGKTIFNYRNVYDPESRFMRGRLPNGEWAQKDFDPTAWGGPFIEGNAWQYHWSVMHDIQGLIDLMGGESNFTAKLDSVFSVPNTVKVGTYGRMIHEMTEMMMIDMGQYAHGNQPVHHMIYLYNYAGEPWKTQKWAREVMRKLYNAGPDGYCGDEDQGRSRLGHLFDAVQFADVLLVAQQHGAGLGGIQRGAAADADDTVGPKGTGLLGGGQDALHPGFGFHVGMDRHLKALFTQQGRGLLRQAQLGQDGIADQKDPVAVQRGGLFGDIPVKAAASVDDTATDLERRDVHGVLFDVDGSGTPAYRLLRPSSFMPFS